MLQHVACSLSSVGPIQSRILDLLQPRHKTEVFDSCWTIPIQPQLRTFRQLLGTLNSYIIVIFYYLNLFSSQFMTDKLVINPSVRRWFVTWFGSLTFSVNWRIPNLFPRCMPDHGEYKIAHAAFDFRNLSNCLCLSFPSKKRFLISRNMSHIHIHKIVERVITNLYIYICKVNCFSQMTRTYIFHVS
jgi:hypothetical protein